MSHIPSATRESPHPSCSQGVSPEGQAVLRDHLGRVQLEDHRLFEQAIAHLAPSKLEGMPKASKGKTLVYSPDDLPIVLKETGAPQNQNLLAKMAKAREICERNDYKYLTIPQARIHGNFIIEKRLPIVMHSTKEQMGLYIENRDSFTSAVREFVGFLCQSTFSDITGATRNPYNTLAKAPMGRYDTLPLYLEDGVGKIGFINLEEFSPQHHRWQTEWCYFKCRDAVCLFPYHLDEIIDAAKTFDPSIEEYRQPLQERRDSALLRFKIAYEDHLAFIQAHGISLEKPMRVVEVTATRRDDILKRVIAKMYKEHADVWYENCLGEDPEKTIDLFKGAFPEILDLTTGFISELLARKTKSINSIENLLDFRSLNFSDNGNLQNRIVSKLGMITFTQEWDWYRQSFATIIVKTIYKEMAGKEIAYYNPSFGVGSYARHCIFC